MNLLHGILASHRCAHVGFLTPQSLHFATNATKWRRHQFVISQSNFSCCNVITLHNERKVNTRIIHAINEPFSTDRRRFLALAYSTVAMSVVEAIRPRGVYAFQSPFAKREDLVIRLSRQSPGRPNGDMFGDDLFYPNYFAGVWKSKSTLKAVASPAGYKLFGRPGSYEAAVDVRTYCFPSPRETFDRAVAITPDFHTFVLLRLYPSPLVPH